MLVKRNTASFTLRFSCHGPWRALCPAASSCPLWGRLCTAHCRPVSSRPASMLLPALETVPPQPQGASDLTAPKRPPGPPALTKPTQHCSPVSTQLPSCSLAISEQPTNLSLLHRTRNPPTLPLSSPAPSSDASALLQQVNALPQLVHYIIRVHHKTPHQPKRGTNPLGHHNQRQTTAPVLAVERQPGTPKPTLPGGYSDSKAATFRFWRATSGRSRVPPRCPVPLLERLDPEPAALESWIRPRHRARTRTNTPIFRTTT